MSRCRDTGEVELRGHLSPIDGEQVANELDRLCQAIRLEDRAAGIERSAAERRAVALVRMATRSAGATGVSPRPLFQVILGADSITRLCELASGVVMRPEDLAPYLSTALVESFLFDESHELLGVSRQRTFTGRMRRAIQVRDRRCQDTSGCPVAATDLRTDVDHVTPWAAGGETRVENGRVRCTPHNRTGDTDDHPPESNVGPPGEKSEELISLEVLRQRRRWRAHHDHPEIEDDSA